MNFNYAMHMYLYTGLKLAKIYKIVIIYENVKFSGKVLALHCTEN